MLSPLRNIPSSLVIEDLSNHKIVFFSKEDKDDLSVLLVIQTVFKDKNGRVNYLGCKTFNKENVSTTQ